jgi:SNF2 family DNA or RNA helicase
MIYVPMRQQVLMKTWLDKHPLAMLWVGCGLGKTAVVLDRIADTIAEGSRGALVVAPLRVAKITWPAQAEQWEHSSWLRVVNLSTKEGAQAWEEGSADIYLTNYERLPSIERVVKGRTRVSAGHAERFLRRKKVPVDTLIVDEISLARNHASKRINALRAYNHHFKRRWGLTGTPIPNSYLDVFAQTRLIDGGERFGRHFTHFRSRYFESDYMGFNYTLRPGAKEEIDEKLKDLVLVLMSKDYLDIPDTRVIDEEIVLPPEGMTAYRTLEKDLLLKLERGEIVALSAASLTNKLIQLTTGVVYDEDRGVHETHDAKVKALDKIIARHKKEPVLVMTAFIHERERLLKRIPGSVAFHEDRIPDWKKGHIKVMVANPGQMSHGIDGLQAGGRIIVWVSPTYSQEKYLQTNARLARTGQGEETLVYRIIAKDTIDEAVMEALRTKEDSQNSAFLALKNLQRLKS